MAITDLLPWKREERALAPRRREEDLFLTLRDEMDRMMEEFFDEPLFSLRPRMLERMGAFFPRVDVSENDKEIVVTAEVPGMDENDVEVSFKDGILTIKGEKRAEKEEKDRRYHRIERTYGSFRRDIEMPCEVEEDKITATYKKGELTVVLPKSTRPEVIGKRIPVQRG